MKISRIFKTVFMIDFITGLLIAIINATKKSNKKIVLKILEIFIISLPVINQNKINNLL